MYNYNIPLLLLPGPEDYIGGNFNVTLGTAADAVGCRDITIVLSNIVQAEEIFLCVFSFTLDEIGIGQPTSANVVIEGGPLLTQLCSKI